MSDIRKILEKYKLHVVKSFGQNFLHDNNIINKIANAVDTTNKNIIEIGTGLGHLTKKLVVKAKKVVSVEIDKKLIPYLNEEFKDTTNLKIISEDFLKIDLVNLIASEFNNEQDVIVIANLPYYLTSPIILKLLENSTFFSSLVLMMQKEVAQRLSAKPNSKEYSNLSVMTQYYCHVKILFDVKPQSFFPAPKVTSSVVLFNINKTKQEIDEQVFWKFVRSCFINKRKTLINNLGNYLNDKVKAIEIVSKLNWSLTIRAEQLTFEMFYQLFDAIKSEN